MGADIHVIDTNVLLVTRGHSADGWPDALVDACEELLLSIQAGGRVATDQGGEIVDEYFNDLSHSGQPTLADAFAVWVRDMRWSWGEDALVDTRPSPDGSLEYGVLADGGRDIPDPSDRKFVAVAAVASAPVHQATDVKWMDWRAVLDGHGVDVRWVDEEHARAMYRDKFGRDPRA